MCRFDRMGPQKIKFVFLKIHLAKMKKNEPMRNQINVINNNTQLWEFPLYLVF